MSITQKAYLVNPSTSRQPLLSQSSNAAYLSPRQQLYIEPQQSQINETILKAIADKSYYSQNQRSIKDVILSLTSRFSTIYPQNKVITVWNAIILFIIIFYILEIGIIMGYKQAWPDQYQYLLGPQIVFILFLFADLFLSMIKAYYSNGLLIVSHRLILDRYLRGPIFIDICGLIAVIVPLASGSYASNFAKILFIPKLYNAYAIDKQFSRATQLNIRAHTFYLLSRLIVIMYTASHYLGIWFYMIDLYVYQNNYYGPNTPMICWLYNAQAYSQLYILLPWYGQYLYTMYFSIGTMTTIAYGDITPLNPLQTLYITVALFFYTIGFGYILSQILRILFQAQAARFEHRNTLLIINMMMRDTMISKDTKEKTIAYFQKIWNQQRYRNRQIQRQMLMSLPLKVRIDLYSEIYDDFMRQLGFKIYLQDMQQYTYMPGMTEILQQQKTSRKQINLNFFNKTNKNILATNFLVKILDSITQERIVEGQIIYYQNEIQNRATKYNHAAYFTNNSITIGVGEANIKWGTISSLQSYKKDKYRVKAIEIANITGLFGQLSLLTGQKRWHWAQTNEDANIFILSRKDFLQALTLASQQQKEQYYYIKQTIRKKICHICKEKNSHHTLQCPYVTFRPNIREIKLKIEEKQKQINEQLQKMKRYSKLRKQSATPILLDKIQSPLKQFFNMELSESKQEESPQSENKLSQSKLPENSISNQITTSLKFSFQRFLNQSLKKNKHHQKYYCLKNYQQQKKDAYRLKKKDKEKLMVSKLYYAELLNQSSSDSEGDSQNSSDDTSQYVQDTKILIDQLISLQQKQNAKANLHISQLKQQINTMEEDIFDVDQIAQYTNYFPEYNLSNMIKIYQSNQKKQHDRRFAKGLTTLRKNTILEKLIREDLFPH